MNRCILLFTVIALSLATYSCSDSATAGAAETDSPEVSSESGPAHSCATRVLATDDTLGRARNHDCETRSLTKTIDRYVAGMKAIDYTGCTPAFTTAFQKHIEAWENITVVTDKYPELRGEMHDLFKQLEEGPDKEAFIPLQAAIWDTWAEVEANN